MNDLKILLNDINKIYQISYYKLCYKNLEQKDKIEECNSNIQNIYNKYNINNINELISIIGEYVKNVEIIRDIELVRLLVFTILDSKIVNTNNLTNSISLIISTFLDSKKRKVLDYNDEILKNIYKYIIENGLYDPNWNIGVSSEPLFTMLPNSSDLYSVNMIVFNNELIDWNILNNGNDSFIYFVYNYLNSSSDVEQSYYFEIIKSAINKVDFDSTKRYKSSQKKVCYEVMSINESLEKLYNNNPSIISVLNLVAQKVKTKN